MTETQFIEQNEHDWNELERLLLNPALNSEKLQDLFVKVSGDLAFASTYFPNRSVRVYLNRLTQRVFDSISKRKTQISFQSFIKFFTQTLPVELYTSRKALLFSLCFFISMLVIGAVSTAYHEDFARVILGDTYVSMTEANINNGDPMAVYKDANKTDMFLGITINNIRVSFLTYILGIFATLGTIIILMYNGIMVGTFQYFFYTKGLFMTSFLTIWIHGTIEISAIIIAGAAGIILGSGLLFPKTYSRLVSLQISAIRSLKILISTVPLFFIAGFLESFVTRQTELPDLVKAGIIVLSLMFILYIYWYYPKKMAKRLDYNPAFYEMDRLPPKHHLNPIGNHSIAEVLLLSITEYGSKISSLIRTWIGPSLIGYCLFIYFNIIFLSELLPKIYSEYLISSSAILIYGFVQYKVLVSICTDSRFTHFVFEPINKLLLFAYSMGMVLLLTVGLSYIDSAWSLLLLIGIPLPVFYLFYFSASGNSLRHHTRQLNLGYTYYARSLLITLLVLGLYYLFYVLINSSVASLFFGYFDMHDGLDSLEDSQLLFNALSSMVINVFMIPFIAYINLYLYISFTCQKKGEDIALKLNTFGDE